MAQDAGVAVPVTDASNIYNVAQTPASSVAQTYFGNFQSGALFAVYIGPGGRGTMLGALPDGTGGFVVDISLDALGNFTAQASGKPVLWAGAADSAGPGDDVRWSFTGQVSGGVLNAQVDTTGENFAAPLTSPTSGTTIAGYFAAPLLNSSDGGIHTIFGADGEALSVLSLATASETATGNIGTDGKFALVAPSGATLTGAIDRNASVLQATLTDNEGATQAVVGAIADTRAADRVAAVSGRGALGTLVISGFAITGSAPLPVVLRAIGPGLGALGVANAAQHPHLRLFDSAGNLLAENSRWDSTNPALAIAFEQTGAFPLAAGSSDAAVLAVLPPGSYTVQAEDDDAGGIVLNEIYSAGAPTASDVTAPRLTAVSTRGVTSADDNVVIGGFVVGGPVAQTVLVRGLGPMLGQSGTSTTLSDPVLRVYDSHGQLIAVNDHWETPQSVCPGQIVATAAELTSAAANSGASPLDHGSADAAVLLNLAPGAYTAEVVSASGQTGEAMVEFYTVAH